MTLEESLLWLGAGVASSVGLPRFLHSHLFRNQLSILTYHAVVREPLEVPDWCFLEEQRFRKQIEYVRRHFQVVPLSQAVAMLTAGSIQDPTVAITFDDGYQNNYEVAFPILAKYECPATIFLSTKYVGSNELPWFCKLNLALTLSTKSSLSWGGTDFNISTSAQKAKASVALHKSFKRHHPYAIDGLVADICRTLEVDAEPKFSFGSPYHMLRTDAIQAMFSSGLITFGAHTHSHSILSQLLPGEQQDEILGSLRSVEQLTGEVCRFFAYPNGSPNDYDRSSIALLESSSVQAAVSTIAGPNIGNTSLFELRRYGVGSDLNFSSFQSMVHHITYRMKQLSSRSRPVHA